MMRFLNGKIPVELVRKKVKGVNITISVDGKVKISVPESLDEKTIDRILKGKTERIERELEKMERLRKRIFSLPKPSQFISGETIWFLGKPLLLEVWQGKEGVKVEGEKLILETPRLEPDVVRNTLIAWLKRMALKVLTEKVEKFSKLVGETPAEIKLKEFKRKWGYCKTDKRIVVFNWRLVQLPEDLIDYVVVHELSHLRYPNHGRGFWECVSKVIPDCYVREEKLKEWIGAVRW